MVHISSWGVTLCTMHMLIVISVVKTAVSKPANGKPSPADTVNGVTSEEMIRMNIEKLKKRAAPKPQKAPTNRFVNLVTVVSEQKPLISALNKIQFPLELCGLLWIVSYVDLRLVFTSDRVVFGIVSRSVEQYDLMKIKLMELEAEHWFCLWLRRLRSSENCIVEVASRREAEE